MKSATMSGIEGVKVGVSPYVTEMCLHGRDI